MPIHPSRRGIHRLSAERNRLTGRCGDEAVFPKLLEHHGSPHMGEVGGDWPGYSGHDLPGGRRHSGPGNRTVPQDHASARHRQPPHLVRRPGLERAHARHVQDAPGQQGLAPQDVPRVETPRAGRAKSPAAGRRVPGRLLRHAHGRAPGLLPRLPLRVPRKPGAPRPPHGRDPFPRRVQPGGGVQGLDRALAPGAVPADLSGSVRVVPER